ncbi:unnamed protein product [Nesidiocoris tenuis]|uniref:Uncharacterized protein n=1 Tax=Nesidiocoris tenuis TaxID=355587 RepID=A0A6H5GYP9_9HEMI|nr:unnamed protein product [Nesidiocoris tenuis]
MESVRGHGDAVSCLAWASPDRLVTGSWDCYVRVWKIRRPFTCLVWDGKTLLVGGAQGTIYLWDLVNVALVKEFQAHTVKTDSSFVVAWSTMLDQSLLDDLTALEGADFAESYHQYGLDPAHDGERGVAVEEPCQPSEAEETVTEEREDNREPSPEKTQRSSSSDPPLVDAAASFGRATRSKMRKVELEKQARTKSSERSTPSSESNKENPAAAILKDLLKGTTKPRTPMKTPNLLSPMEQQKKMAAREAAALNSTVTEDNIGIHENDQAEADDRSCPPRVARRCTHPHPEQGGEQVEELHCLLPENEEKYQACAHCCFPQLSYSWCKIYLFNY